MKTVNEIQSTKQAVPANDYPTPLSEKTCGFRRKLVGLFHDRLNLDGGFENSGKQGTSSNNERGILRKETDPMDEAADFSELSPPLCVRLDTGSTRFCLLVVLFLVIVLGVAIGVVGRTRSTRSKPMNNERLSLIESILEARMNGAKPWTAYLSPQYQAFRWLTENDTLRMDSLNHGVVVERYAVAVMYFSMEGYNWYNQLGFLYPDSVCEWNEFNATRNGTNIHFLGVGCADRTSVSKVSFSKCLAIQDISGKDCTLSRRSSFLIGFFTQAFNDLAGTIPTEIALLSSLQVLEFVETGLHGYIPTELGCLSNLEEFHIDLAHLSGDIPTQLGHLPSLALLEVSKLRNASRR